MIDLYVNLPNDFEQRYKEYRNELLGNEQNKILSGIYYNQITGVGCVNGKEFKLKDNTAEYRVFNLLYGNIGKKVSRYDVLVGAHFYEDGADIDPTRKIGETSKINDVVKKIRFKLNLSVNELVNNNGNLTLIYNKTENPPNTPQT
ncbi:MAG: hypothetical protein WCW47_00715 [Candidatus Paceibacterota bacterium]|jgi:hypothetical protein